MIPGAVKVGARSQWPLSSVLPPMGAGPEVPAIARAHATETLARWNLAALADDASLVVSELVTNGVRASTGPDGNAVYVLGKTPVIRTALHSDGRRVLIEAFDQAGGRPVMRCPSPDAVSGRGLPTVDYLAGGRWDWYPLHAQLGKCVWAVLEAPSGGALSSRAGSGVLA